MITLHDEKHEKPLIMPDPLLSDPLPSVRDEYWEDSKNDEPVSGCFYTVSTTIPKNSDSFCRQVQASRLMGIVQDVLRQPYEDNPPVIRERIFHVDCQIKEALTKLIFDCNGTATQYCGPISLLVAYACSVRFVHKY